MSLRLRPLGPDDELQALAAHRDLARDDFVFLLGYRDGMDWAEYLDQLERERLGLQLAPGRVTATFLVAEADSRLVARSSIRTELSAHLAEWGGHIGFGVVSAHRRRGYATEVLRQSLVIARSLGVSRALVTCDDGNVGSAAVIERCGGVFESMTQRDGDVPVRRYWVD